MEDTTYDCSVLAAAVQALSAVCDGAQEEDGSGFNKPDSSFGHRMAKVPAQAWNLAQANNAYRMLRKYRGQLSGFGIDYDAIVMPPAAPAGQSHRAPTEKRPVIRTNRGWEPRDRVPQLPPPPPSLTFENDIFTFAFDFRTPGFYAIVDGIKSIPGRRFDGIKKVWTVALNLSNAEAVLDVARRFDFPVTDAMEERCLAIMEVATKNIVASRAEDAEFSVAGLGGTLRPFQRAGVQYASRAKRCLIGDDMGLGKTVQGLATVQETGAYPTLIVCPASVKINWSREAAKWLPGASVIVLNGQPSPGLSERLKRFVALDAQVRNYRLQNNQNVHGGGNDPTHLNLGHLNGSVGLDVADVGGSSESAQPLHQSGVRVVDCNGPSAIAGGAADGSLSINDAGEVCQVSSGIGQNNARGTAPSNGDQQSTALHQLAKSGKTEPNAVGDDAVSFAALQSEHRALQISLGDFAQITQERLLFIVNYDVLVKWVSILKDYIKSIIFDEFHYCKNPKAKRSEAAKELATGLDIRIGLTGTPVLNRPSELINLLTILDRVNDVGGYGKIIYDYAGGVRGDYGVEYPKTPDPARLEELNTKLRATCMIRRTKSQVLTELPEKTRTNLWLKLDNQKEYDRAEKEAAASDEPAAHLVRINTLRKLAAQGKLAAAKEWIADFLESGEKLVMFAHHIEIQNALAAEFPGCAVIRGEDDALTRQENVDRFQNDPNCKLIVCSLKAAREGITLTAASNIAFLEQGWHPGEMQQAEDRVHRIGQRNAVNVWYLLAEETIDVEMKELIDSKGVVIKALAEGNKITEEELLMLQASAVSRIMASIKAKHKKIYKPA